MTWFFQYRQVARVKQAQRTIEMFAASLREFKMEGGELPNSLYPMDMQPEPSSGDSLWIKKCGQSPMPNDPWDKPYNYSKTEDSFRVWSSGPDGISGNKDDIEGGSERP